MIIVTGGTGLVGSHLLYELVKSGQPVRAIRRAQSATEVVKKVFAYYSPDAEALFNKIEWFEADLLDVVSLEEAFEGVEQVYHAAAMVSFSPKDAYRIIDENRDSTANIVNLCLEKQVKRLCHVSSIAALGRTKDQAQIDENTTWKNSPNNSKYAISKYESEKEVWRGIEEGLQAVIVNPGIILGPGNWNRGSGRLFGSVWKGVPYYTRGINAFVDVRDVVACMIALMERKVQAERFVITAENKAYKEVFSHIAEALGKKKPSIEIKQWMGEIAWRLDKLRSLLTGKDPMLTRETFRTISNQYFYNNKKVTDLLDFNWISIEQSIADTCRLFLLDPE